MSSAAQILANQSNSQRSTGPVTPEGKAAAARNAAKFGLFSATNFIRPEEREIFAQFSADYTAELCPDGALEQTLAREIVHAAWRLRRCADLELAPPENAGPEELDRLQSSVDRARGAAQRTLHRSLAELRRVQTERVYRAMALSGVVESEGLGQANCQKIDPLALIVKQASAQDALIAGAVAKQSQSAPATTAAIPRNAPCPCGSGEKYKRCCGRNAPPVLTGR